MKKTLLVLTLVLSTCSVWAQSLTGEIPSRGKSCPPFIPKEFTQNGKAKFLDRQTGQYDVYAIYNDNFEIDQQVSIYGTPYTYTDEEDGETRTIYCYFYDVYYYNLDAVGSWFDNYAKTPLTQTLFNNDNKYEYIAPPELVNDGQFISLKIMSDDETLVSTIAADNGYYFDVEVPIKIIRWNNSYYLMLIEWPIVDGTQTGKIVFYLINRTTQSISRVDSSLPINVFPSVVDRGQTITIELGEDNNATEVQVVNASGQVVKSIAVQPGQREVQLRTSDLDSGMHVIGARNRSGQGACKIIVK